ncbi:helicase associated domain-containing protein [Streptomyces lydicamycinicus]|uniref:helicase associated domain-containing protein n=1 Tax=Streptomyces lydicamycinicus TaxID=1546107 RepID=UPI003D800CB8
MPAKALLKFSTPRDPAALAAFINLRVLSPERELAARGGGRRPYAREHGDLRVPFTYRVPAGEDAEAEGWPAPLADFPLGQWTADARRFYARGDMDEDRVEQLEKLGMIWSHSDVAWEEGLTAARGWAAEHGHLLAPLDATFQGAAVGIWLKNARAAARKAMEIEQRRAEGLPVESSAGAMSQERREQLEDIDASWCPVWPVTWQRCFHLVRLHLDEGGALPTAAGDVVRQGEDLGRWVTSVRLGWDKLTGVQQWMCEHRTRDRGREAEAADQPGRQVGRQPRRRPAVLRARGAPSGAAQARRDGALRGPGGAGAPARGMDREPAQQGRGPVPGTRRATLRNRHALGIEVARVTRYWGKTAGPGR